MLLPLHKLSDIRVAAECCIIAEDFVLLQKRPDDSTNFPGYWTFPGGHIDEKEDALTAIIREVHEETGIVVLPQDVSLKVSAINHHSDKNQVWVVYGFHVMLSKKVSLVNSSEGNNEWFALDSLSQMQNIFPPIAIYLDHIVQKDSGVLYMSGEWKSAELVTKHTWVIDSNA